MITHTPTPGNVHWVYAHPRRRSLNGELLDAGLAALQAQPGRTVQVSDLYADGFDPRLGETDLGVEPPVPGSIGQLAGQAHARGEQAPEVTREQDRLAAAELLVLQFPLWWYGPPAILKGWFDRVLAEGFAYGDADQETGIPRRYGDGGLAGRRALVVVTVGEDAATLGPRGLSGDLDQVLFPLTHGVLWYTGIEVLDLHVVHDADSLGAEGVVRERERLADRLARIESEGAVPFRALRDGDYAGTRALREDELPGRVDLRIHRVGG